MWEGMLGLKTTIGLFDPKTQTVYYQKQNAARCISTVCLKTKKAFTMQCDMHVYVSYLFVFHLRHNH